MLGISSLITLVIAVFGVGFVIGFHEFGHLIFCKLFDIYAPSFSIGFGPRIAHKKIGETDFALSAIPLGGYVEIATHPDPDNPAHAKINKNRFFAGKPYYQKMLVMLGGIGFNVIFAYIAFSLLALTGLPDSPMLFPFNSQPTIRTVAPDSAAQKGGLLVGDVIIKINETPINDDVLVVLKTYRPLANTQALFHIEREGTPKEISLTVGARDVGKEQVGMLGVSFESRGTAGLPLFDAIKRGISLTHAYLWGTAQVFLSIFKQRSIDNLGGPLLIISETMKATAAGFKILLLLLAIISINLAVLNTIPLPIMDGGQMLFYTIEAVMGRPLPAQIREYIHLATWVLMLILVLYLTLWDAIRIAKPILASFGY